MSVTLIEPETERLWLRQWRPADLEPFAQLNGDPVAMEYFPRTLVPIESRALAERFRGEIDRRGWGFWAVERKDTAAFIGFVGLNVPLSDLPFQPCVEIGWRLAPEHWGQGFATEAARASLHCAFETLRLPKIVSFTAEVNARSYAVMERLGMRRVLPNFEHPNVEPGHRLREHRLYEIEFVDWHRDTSA